MGFSILSGGITGVTGAVTAETLVSVGADPNADRIIFWDDSAGALKYLGLGSGISISGTTLNVSAGNVVVSELTEWATSFSSTSGTYVDITDATVTLSGLDSSATYDLECYANFCAARNNTANSDVRVGLMIDSVIVSEVESNVYATAGTRQMANIFGFKRAFTGATSVTAKLQGSNNGGGTSTWVINDGTFKAQILLKAVKR